MSLINYLLASSKTEGNSSNTDGDGASGTAAAVPTGRAELLSLRRVLLESRDIYCPINVESQLQAAKDQVCAC